MSAKDFAGKLIQRGLSVLPVDPGVKKPPFKWKDWQTHIMALEDVETLFNGKEIGVICGAVSGGLECLDFDDPSAFDEWKAILTENGFLDEIQSCYIQRTPSGGWHVVYRAGEVGGNQKLATVKDGKAARIETRGEGGYFKCYPSTGYQAKNRNLLDLPTLDADAHEAFLNAARYCSHHLIQKEMGMAHPGADPGSPGVEFESKGTWEEILEPKGWVKIFSVGDTGYWRRPGKNGKAVSATTNHKGRGYFWCFSTSTEFQSDRAYNKFACLSLLWHQGDFSATARHLADNGYGRFDREGNKTSVHKEVSRVTPKVATLVLRTFGEEFEYVEPKFLIRPYIRLGKAVLLDADGGTGKTSLTAAMAAWFSKGWSMLGDYEGEPIHTIYLHKGEDEDSEIETVYRANGGVPGFLHYGGKGWNMTEQGCKVLEDTIKQFDGPVMVVLDALFYFLQDLPTAHLLQKDSMAVTKALEPLMDVYQRTGSAGVHLRHTTKGAVDKAASELGMGSQAFRNRHRGQLVMRYHPDKEQFPGVVGLTDEKGSLLVQRGEPFFFKREGLTVEQVISITEDPWEKRKVTTPGAREAAMDWLRKFIGTDTKYFATVMQEAKANGIPVGTFYRALKALGAIEDTCGGRKTIQLPDPFA